MRSLSHDLARWRSRMVVVAMGLTLGASATWAQTTTTLLQQSFTSGLGTYGSIHVVQKGRGRFTAHTRYRDVDGRLRRVASPLNRRNTR